MTNEYLYNEAAKRLIETPQRLGNFSAKRNLRSNYRLNEKFPSERKRYKNSRREVSAVFVLFLNPFIMFLYFFIFF
jgi:hypothetical protein